MWNWDGYDGCDQAQVRPGPSLVLIVDDAEMSKVLCKWGLLSDENVNTEILGHSIPELRAGSNCVNLTNDPKITF